MGGKVLLAMSGGVDSSVAAVLLQAAGYTVVGATMRLWFSPAGEENYPENGCCSLSAVEDARRVTARLGIDHYVLNFRRPFKTLVVDYFTREYRRGRTPNPCIACNRFMKFDLLLEKALGMGFDYIATGHYARIRRREGQYHLLRGKDRRKDQSYALYSLTQGQLARTLFPLGDITKDRVRAIARRNGLAVAEKAESQEICFIPDNNYHRFLQQEQDDVGQGYIYDTAGKILGKHKGYPYYTVGQRRGLGVAAGKPLYVVEIKPAENAVVVGTLPELEARGLMAEDCSYVSGSPPAPGTEADTQIRYHAPAAESRLWPQSGGKLKVRFHFPQRAVAPGQAAVLYRGEEVLGGGVIVGRWDELSECRE